MSEKESSKAGNTPHVPDHDPEHAGEQAEELAASGDEREAEVQEVERPPVEAQLPADGDNERRAEVHAAECRPVAAESRDSGHDSPLECATRDSGDSGHYSPQGAVGGVLDDIDRKSNMPRMKSGKEDLFRKFFDKEYDLPPGVPILGRRRHPAEMQGFRHRHVSEESRLSQETKLSDPNPLGCLQDVGTSSGALLNQAGAIIGKNIPKEEIQEFNRFGTEFGQSLPLVPRKEGSERSISSVETARIADVYGYPFSETPSDESRGLSPGSSFPSFSSRPSTAASEAFKTSPPPDSDSPKDDKPLSPSTANPESSEGKATAEDAENSLRRKPIRQRRFGVVTRPVQVRSKSAHAGYSCYAGESADGEPERKISKDMSVCSEPLPERKLSKDSSVDYEQASFEDESCPELSHSLEGETCLPTSDIDPELVESLQGNLEDLTSSSDMETNAVEQSVSHETEQDPDAVSSCIPDAEASQHTERE